MYKFYYTNGYGVTSYIRKSMASLWQTMWNPNIRKWLMRINLTCLILLIAFMQVTLAANAQKISLSKKNATLTEVFRELKKQSGYGFMINREQIKIAKPVTINTNGDELEKVLDKCFEGQPFTYKLEGNMIVVIDKKPEQIKINAPPIDVKGRLVDENGTALFGASVMIKGTELKTITNQNGEFTFTNVDEKAILVISFIGYEVKEVSVKVNLGDIKMSISTGKLDEVIVSTGYQNIPKERITGSFVQPIKEMYAQRVATDVLGKLSGITSGLLFNANTTASTNGLDINIRGRNTIYANDQPLIIVDNFPYSGNIADLNPNDYEEPTILRDAAAASIWGVRAGNGVIVFTSKKGRANQPLKISLNANLTVSNKPDLNYNPNQLNASSYINLERFLYNNGFYDGSLGDTTSYPAISPVVELLAANPANLEAQLNQLRSYNNNDQLSSNFYQRAVNQQYALNLSGGSDKAIYYLSAGYDKNLPVQKENSYQRITLNAQNTFYPFKKVEINVGINLIHGISKAGSNLITINNNLFPYTQFTDAGGNALPITYGYRQSYAQGEVNNGLLDWTYVPLNELGATDNTTKNLDVRTNTALKYTFVKGLSGELRYQYQRGNIQGRIYNSQETYYARNLINRFAVLTNNRVSEYNIPLGGILNQNNANNIAHNFRGQLNFERAFGDHYITALAGYELSQTTGDSNSSLLYGYDDALATYKNIDAVNAYPTNPSGGSAQINSGLGITGTLVRIRSTFANASYSYKNRYYLTGSTRIDGTNYFGVATNQKSVPLWSMGIRWDIAKESFYNFSWLPVLSLRGSYGYNGNLDRNVTGTTTFQYSSNATNTGLNYATISNYGNPDLRWEKTGIANFAIDFATKNSILTGSIEYYIKKQTDLLGERIFPSNSGITSLRGNYSDMKGNGFDVTLTSDNLRGIFRWSTTLLLSHATDEVTRYDVPPFATTVAGSGGSIAAPIVGKPVFGLYGFKWGGLDPTGNPKGFFNGTESQDYAAITNNTPLTDLIYAGPARPTYFGGLNNRFTYKGISLAVQISYKFGYYFRKPTINYSQMATSAGNAFLQVNRDLDSRWQKPGDEANTNVPALIYPFNPARDQFYQYAEINFEKGDHVRLQDITLSYDFSKKLFRRLALGRLQVYAYANNLAILWRANKAGLDPDAVPGNGDRSVSPIPRSLSIGVRTSF